MGCQFRKEQTAPNVTNTQQNRLKSVENTVWRLKIRKAQIINFSGEKSGNKEWQRYGDSNPGLMAENHLSYMNDSRE
jgi:hypothetical protein